MYVILRGSVAVVREAYGLARRKQNASDDSDASDSESDKHKHSPANGSQGKATTGVPRKSRRRSQEAVAAATALLQQRANVARPHYKPLRRDDERRMTAAGQEVVAKIGHAFAVLNVGDCFGHEAHAGRVLQTRNAAVVACSDVVELLHLDEALVRELNLRGRDDIVYFPERCREILAVRVCVCVCVRVCVCVCVCVCVVKGCRAAYLNALTCRASRTILNLHW